MFIARPRLLFILYSEAISGTGRAKQCTRSRRLGLRLDPVEGSQAALRQHCELNLPLPGGVQAGVFEAIEEHEKDGKVTRVRYYDSTGN